jgi:hypothetical protein
MQLLFHFILFISTVHTHSYYTYCTLLLPTNVVCLMPKCRNTMETPNGEKLLLLHRQDGTYIRARRMCKMIIK